jgi:predicted permease
LTAGLLAAQIAFSLCLLSGAGLLVRTLSNLRGQPADFAQDSVAVFTLAPVADGYRDRDIHFYYRDLVEQIRAIPGIASAARADRTPLDFWGSPSRIEAASAPAITDATATSACVSPELFPTLETPLLSGRLFRHEDGPNAEKVAIVNAALARSLFGGRNPLGELIGFGLQPDVHDRRIVGVVRDRGYRGFRESDTPAVYIPCTQRYAALADGYLTLVVRAAGPAEGMVEPVRQKVEALGVEFPVRIATLQERAEQSLIRERALAALSSAVAVIALGLAIVGLYSLTAYTVRNQRRAIGVRIAVGADRRTVLRWVFSRALFISAAGVAIGLPLAVFGGRYVESSLFGVSSANPLALAGAGAILLTVSLLAALAPALEAASIQPMEALRQD